MADQYKDDEMLAKDFVQGVSGAFEEIFNRYSSQLFALAFRLTKDTNESKDIVVISLNALFEKHTDFQHINQIRAFVFTTVKNRCLNFSRNQKRARLRNEQYLQFQAETSLDNDILDLELTAMLFKLVQQLPSQSKTVVQLYYMQGKKYKEIADELKLSPKTVENHLRLALGKLRSAIAEKWPALHVLFITAASSFLAGDGLIALHVKPFLPLY